MLMVQGLKCYKMLRVYKTLVNSFNKHLEKNYKTLAKKL